MNVLTKFLVFTAMSGCLTACGGGSSSSGGSSSAPTIAKATNDTCIDVGRVVGSPGEFAFRISCEAVVTYKDPNKAKPITVEIYYDVVPLIYKTTAKNDLNLVVVCEEGMPRGLGSSDCIPFSPAGLSR